MDQTLIKVVAFIFFLGLLGADYYAPHAHPQRQVKLAAFAVSGIAGAVTIFHISLIAILIPVDIWIVPLALLALSIAPPLIGLAEAHHKKNGQAVFATGVSGAEANRFPMHLGTNILGALAVTLLYLAARTLSGFLEFSQRFELGPLFNVALPVSALIALQFARTEQVKKAGGALEKFPADELKRRVVGYSMSHLHQMSNTLYLTIATFIYGSLLLYMISYALESRQGGEVLPVTLPVVGAIIMTLIFFLACGLPIDYLNRFKAFRALNIEPRRPEGAVWMTFVTGTPAAIAVAAMWLLLYQCSVLRNVSLVTIVLMAWTLFAVEVILNEGAIAGRLYLHYYSSLAVALMLVVLLGSVYLEGA